MTVSRPPRIPQKPLSVWKRREKGYLTMARAGPRLRIEAGTNARWTSPEISVLRVRKKFVIPLIITFWFY